MKTTIETLEFPCEFKKKRKRKVSMGNLKVEFIDITIHTSKRYVIVKYIFNFNSF